MNPPVSTTPIAIPKASQAITEGTIIEWMVEDGGRVAAGQVLYRLETDKVEMDVEAPVSGVLRISGTVGQTYLVGTEIGRIESD